MIPFLKHVEDGVLKSYCKSDFVKRQKARVLVWLHICLIPTIVLYIMTNILRNHSRELIGIIIVDCLFLTCLTAGIFLIHKGKSLLTANLDIILTMVLTTAGCMLKLGVQTSTGFNSFYLLLLCSLVFTAMFGNRKTLIAAAIYYIGLVIVLHFMASQEIPHGNEFNLISGTLNMIIALVIIGCISYMNATITKTALQQTQNELDKNIELNDLLRDKVEKRTEEVQVLKGLLPICASCKKIRDDNGYWNQIECYIQAHSQAEFSHGICPECAKKLYPEIFK